MQEDCGLEVLCDVHGQTFVEVGRLLIVFEEEELVTPVQRNVVEEGDEVQDGHAAAVRESHERLDHEVGVQCGAIHGGTGVECLQVLLQYKLRIALGHFGLKFFFPSSILVTPVLSFGVLNEEIEMWLECVQE